MDPSKTVVYVGKTVKYNGKRLFDILCRLKNFGIGRVVYQQSEKDKYVEPCYYRITSVQPDMSDPTQAKIDNRVESSVLGHKVFRGNALEEQVFNMTYKADWKLVLKEDEEDFLAQMALAPVHKKNKILKEVRFPPLLERMIMMKKHDNSVLPMLPLVIVNAPYPDTTTPVKN